MRVSDGVTFDGLDQVDTDKVVEQLKSAISDPGAALKKLQEILGRKATPKETAQVQQAYRVPITAPTTRTTDKGIGLLPILAVVGALGFLAVVFFLPGKKG